MLDKPSLTIDHRPDNDLVLVDKLVSHRCAEIRGLDDNATLYENGTRVLVSVLVQPGDVVRLGRSRLTEDDAWQVLLLFDSYSYYIEG